MKKRIVFVLFLLGCGMLEAPSLWAQKRLLPIARAVKGDAVKNAVGGQTGKTGTSGFRSALGKELEEVADAAAAEEAFLANVSLKNIRVQQEEMEDLLSQLLELYYQANVSSEWAKRNREVVTEVKKLWLWNNQFLNNWLFKSIYKPIEWPSEFAVKNNKIVLLASRNFFGKMQWLANVPDQGRKLLGRLQSDNVLGEFAQKLNKERMILIGEQHGISSVQQTITKLVLFLKKQNPRRRVILFTEFIDLNSNAPREGSSLSDYYLKTKEMSLDKLNQEDFSSAARIDYAANLFLRLFQEKVEIYPLEDRRLMEVLEQECGPMCQVKNPALSISLRNKTWARIIERKMAAVRQTDPNALFVVYAGIGHTSWLLPYSLPKFFAAEKPAVVEVTLGQPSSVSALYTVWGKEDVFFTPHSDLTLYYWKSGLGRIFAQKTGFDYALVVPEENR